MTVHDHNDDEEEQQQGGMPEAVVAVVEEDAGVSKEMSPDADDDACTKSSKRAEASEVAAGDDLPLMKSSKRSMRKTSSRRGRKGGDDPDGDDLPIAVNTTEELVDLPAMYRSDDPKRPLLLTVEGEPPYKYALNPVTFSVLAILVIECLERFAYYGINNNETAFLEGAYDENWNANLTSSDAVSFTSGSVAIAYTTPFIGGILADGFTGDFWAIVIGISVFYLPGLFLIALTTVPGLLGETFNMAVLKAGMLGLMPTGTGFIKPLVNVFGAKQFHPVVQSALVEPYYVNFYIAINIGALIGGIIIPIIAQTSIEIAFFIPFVAMCCGFLLFLLCSPRFVKRKPEKAALFNTLGLLGKSVFCCQSFAVAKESNDGPLPDTFVDGVWRLLKLIPVNLLVLPFNIVYNCMTGIFIMQGEAMQEVGVINASWMTNFDSFSVLIVGFFASSWLYPYLERRGINFPYCYRFSVGTLLGALAIGSALIVDSQIRNKWKNEGAEVNIFAQIMNYAFVGAGEIFAVSTAYEAAFMIAPKEQKALASAIQLFMGNGLASYIQIGLQQGLADWLPQSPGVESYVESQMDKFLWVLFGISCFAILFNLLPPVKNWLERLRFESLEAAANDNTQATALGDSTDELKSGQENDDTHKHDVVDVDSVRSIQQEAMAEMHI